MLLQMEKASATDNPMMRPENNQNCWPIQKKVATSGNVSTATVSSLNCNQYAFLLSFAWPTLFSSGWICEIVNLVNLSVKLLELLQNKILDKENVKAFSMLFLYFLSWTFLSTHIIYENLEKQVACCYVLIRDDVSGCAWHADKVSKFLFFRLM